MSSEGNFGFMTGQTSSLYDPQTTRDSSAFEYFYLKSGHEALIRVVKHKFFSYYRHTVKREGKKQFLKMRCSAPSEETGGKCICCYYNDPDSKMSALFGPSAKVVVATVYDLRKIHEMVGAGNKRIVDSCFGKGCKYCATKNVPKTIGRRYWELGSAHFKLLVGANLSIGDHCISCKEGTISMDALVCAQCGEDIFSEADFSKLTPLEKKQLLDKSFTCMNCSHVGIPKEHISCNTCDKPVRASIFDTNIKVSKYVDAAQPEYPVLSLEPTYKYEPAPEGVKEYDFDNIVFPVYTLDAQAKLCKVRNPWGVSKEQITPRDEEQFFTDDVPE